MENSSIDSSVFSRGASLHPKGVLPKHVAVIMDGNGRWAEMRRLPRMFGHREGVRRVSELVEECARLNIEALTLYAFSEENWHRPQAEVKFLMRLLNIYLRIERRRLQRNNVQLRVIGDESKLPEFCRNRLDSMKELLKNNTGMVLTLALSYGSQAEILAATRSLLRKMQSGELNCDQQIDAGMFAAELQTRGLPELDLVIRTSGEKRLSNFLLWQAAYAELYFSDVLWPDFHITELHKAFSDYAARDRRFGRVKSIDAFDDDDAAAEFMATDKPKSGLLC